MLFFIRYDLSVYFGASLYAHPLFLINYMMNEYGNKLFMSQWRFSVNKWALLSFF